MEHSTPNKNRRLHAALLISLLLLFLFVFNSASILNLIDPKPTVVVNSPNSIRAESPWNQYHVDSCERIVKNGDLVLRAGADAISALFKKANTRDKSYSHAGIVFIENGYPMVYNAIASADDPHAAVSRDSLKNFIDPFNNTAYAVYRYKLNKLEVDKLHNVMKEYYKERREFDPHFDLTTDSLLYCTEFVYKGMAAATGLQNYLTTTHAGGFEYVAVDDLFLKKGIKMICKIVYKQ